MMILLFFLFHSELNKKTKKKNQQHYRSIFLVISLSVIAILLPFISFCFVFFFLDFFFSLQIVVVVVGFIVLTRCCFSSNKLRKLSLEMDIESLY